MPLPRAVPVTLTAAQVRRVRAPGGVVHEPRLARILGTDLSAATRSSYRPCRREVVRLAVLALRHPDRRVVLGDDRVPLAQLGAQEPQEWLKPHPLGHRPNGPAAPCWPSGSGAACRTPPCCIRFPAAPGEQRTVLRDERRVPGKATGQLADRPEADRMMVTAGQQRRPSRRAQMQSHGTGYSAPPPQRSGSWSEPRSGRRTRSAGRSPHHQAAPAGRSAQPPVAPTLPIRPQSGRDPIQVVHGFAHHREPGIRDRQPGTVNWVICHEMSALSDTHVPGAGAGTPTAEGY